MLYAYVLKFDVTENLKNSWKLNKTLVPKFILRFHVTPNLMLQHHQ
jgi:hypothetical protein